MGYGAWLNHGAAGIDAGLTKFRKAWKTIAMLHLTSYLFPPGSVIKDGDKFDFIIVGGGTSGCVIANRLTENKNFRVLLIEAGEDPPVESVEYRLSIIMKESRVDWQYAAEYDKKLGQCHQSPYLDITIGKMLGGTSSLNAGFYSRGSYVDYDKWAAAANDSTWSFKKVLPYFIKSERLEDSAIKNSPDREFHGFSGYMGVTTSRDQDEDNAYGYVKGITQTGVDLRLDLNGNNPLGIAATMFLHADGHRQSSAYSFIRPIKNRPNLYVMKNTKVTKLRFDKNKHAIGVEVLTKCNVSMTLKAEKEVILAAGTFNTPKLLMLSGIGPKSELQSKGIRVLVDLPVGKNLQDHSASLLYIKLDKAKRKPLPKDLVNDYFAPTTYSQETFNKSQDYPDFGGKNFYYDSAQGNLKYCVGSQRFKYEICDRIYQKTKGYNVLANVIINYDSKSKGEVLLRSADPKDLPIIKFKYFSNKVDIKNLAEYTKSFLKVLDTPYFKKIGAELVDVVTVCNEFERGTMEYYQCYVTCMNTARNNFCGTCSMGSVVDGRLRVYGIKRLRVADASIIPTIPRAELTAPTIMIGEKAADFIKKDYE